jgi:molecular chaperone DnaJ
LAREHHPDRNPEDGQAQQRFQEINAAYQILSDPRRRARLDQLGDTSRNGSGPTGAPDLSGLQDLLRDLFGGFAAPRVDRGDLEAVVEITFEEVALGCTKTLRYERRDTCADCDGSGRAPTGKCSGCSGSGLTSRVREVAVNVPAGIEDGASQTVRGGGNRARRQGPPGDLELMIRVAADPRFSRQGDDVHSRVEIPFSVCASGGTVQVTTVYGNEPIDVPPGTGHGDEVRLRGRGMPHRFRSGQGDHFAEVVMQIPRATSERARELVHEYAAASEHESGLFDKVRSWFAG